MTIRAKRKGIPEDLFLGRDIVLRGSMVFTMIIISDYRLEYNEELNIFGNEQ
ncbi:MAG: hypothetical protein SOR91_06160 [Hornefia butyriciproducens]|uniref:hypothetical protein n=1 Tax=Hornefia butyriciproducens TaxID=2652293 RepID=UPI002A75AF92|nr:hypothetical protein [Hornefia butyriciproducens]MDY2991040.1 hypothetical protein [Hornefia butyriciproducens]